LRGLAKKELIDEDTAIIITGDHSYPESPEYLQIPNAGKEVIERMPWIFISPRTPFALDTKRLSGQADTGPTIAHLAGVTRYNGWWGGSLLSAAPARPQMAWRNATAFRIDSKEIAFVPAKVAKVGWYVEGNIFPVPHAR
jgi:phosphoglycerol transferase MdoB-like AlkP superfamily enzyme